MSEDHRRVRIRIRDHEVELEGPADFVERYRDRWEPLLDLAASLAAGEAEASYEIPVDEPSAPVAGAEDPYVLYRSNLTAYDRVLVACYHAQQQSEEHAFRWPDAARVAVDGGLASSDAAAEFQYLLDIRHVMRIKRGMHRVSAKGVDALHKLLATTPQA